LRAKKWKGIDFDGSVEFTGFEYVGENSKIKFRVGNDTYTVYANRFYEANIIKEISPYANWPIDAKVLVWGENKNKNKRYFAGIHEDGRPMAWIGGATSWSDPTTFVWDYAELAED
jgi:hypothetical protein